ncbi:unnamed protein product [Sphagnum troendelagicum]|uniref:Uncharacterized protein n=1 Tax=Sphagnum jensenii TaxID=128206 RepID=A0ABP0VK46_9BRYO
MSTTTTTTTISSQTLSKESSSQVDSSANYSTSSSYSVTSSQQQQVLGIKDMLSDGAIIFKLKDLSMATKNFHPAKKMGSSVFRGSLHGMDVAVMVLKNNNNNKGSGGGGSDFFAEMKNLYSSKRSTFKQSHSIQISGRHGYMALEEKVGGLITPKLDVFAFGKELGRRLQAWMNPLLGDSAPLDYTLKTAELAKDCVDLDPNSRPNIPFCNRMNDKIPFCNRMNDKIHACLPSIPCQDNHNYTLRSNLLGRKDSIMSGRQCQ